MISFFFSHCSSTSILDSNKTKHKNTLHKNTYRKRGEIEVEPAKRKAELDEKVKALEAEKACLIAEIETLKAIPLQEEKVANLESDITQLKQEKKALEEKVTPPPPCEEPAAEQAAETTPAEAPTETPAETPAPEATPTEPAEAPTTETTAPAEEKPCEEKPSE
jgi:chromosome segregation ATPase